MFSNSKTNLTAIIISFLSELEPFLKALPFSPLSSLFLTLTYRTQGKTEGYIVDTQIVIGAPYLAVWFLAGFLW